MENNCPHCKSTHRPEEEYRSLINRLSRIEGQIRGIRGMLERDAYCIDIITQVSAVSSALSAFNKELLSSHINTCVREGVRGGDEEKLTELIDTLNRIIK